MTAASAACSVRSSCSGPPRPANADIDSREVAGGLNQPVGFTFGPGRVLWCVEKAARSGRTTSIPTRTASSTRSPG